METKKIIEEQKKSLLDLFKNEKFHFIFVLTRIALALLLMIGLLLPSIVGADVIGGHMSLSQQFATINLGLLFWLPFLLSIPGYFLMVLMKKQNLKQIMLLIQVCGTSVVFAWGLLAYIVLVRGGFVISLGFGFYLTLILLAFLWYVFFNEKFLFDLVRKVFSKAVKDETDYSQMFVKEPSDLYEEKSIVLCIVLSIFTFGIYGFVWLYSIARKLKLLNEDDKNILVEFLLMIFVPFYIFFWLNKAGARLSQGAQKHNIQISNDGMLYWLLAFFGLGVVSYALIQNKLNTIAKTLKSKESVAEVIETANE